MSIDPSLQFEESQEDYGEPDMRHILGFLN